MEVLGCCVVFRVVLVGPKIPAGGERESPYLMLHTHHLNDSVIMTSSSMKSFFYFLLLIVAKLHVVHKLQHFKKKVAQIGLNPGLSADQLSTYHSIKLQTARIYLISQQAAGFTQHAPLSPSISSCPYVKTYLRRSSGFGMLAPWKAPWG